MAKTKSTKPQVENAQLWHKLSNEQFSRLYDLVEQIGGLNNMLFVAVQKAIEESNEAMTAHTLLGEKYEEARLIVEAVDAAPRGRS